MSIAEQERSVKRKEAQLAQMERRLAGDVQCLTAMRRDLLAERSTLDLLKKINVAEWRAKRDRKYPPIPDFRSKLIFMTID